MEVDYEYIIDLVLDTSFRKKAMYLNRAICTAKKVQSSEDILYSTLYKKTILFCARFVSWPVLLLFVFNLHGNHAYRFFWEHI